MIVVYILFGRCAEREVSPKHIPFTLCVCARVVMILSQNVQHFEAHDNGVSKPPWFFHHDASSALR